MGECPFCSSEVGDDLITFGGTCPKCFADIPGEEAATDPGEDVKAEQARRDQMRATMRTVLPLLMAIPVVAVLAIAALWFVVLRPEPQVMLLDFDEGDDYPIPELVAAAPEPEVEPDRVETNDGVAAAPDNAPAPDNALAPKPAAPKPRVDPAPSGGLNLSLDVSASRRGVVLDDPEAIREMIGKRLTGFAPRLNGCYERELKNDENLAGRWRIAFVIGTDGKTKSVTAEALSGSVPSFETCLGGEVGKWQFERIARDQPVRKTFTFRPAY